MLNKSIEENRILLKSKTKNKKLLALFVYEIHRRSIIQGLTTSGWRRDNGRV